MVCTRSRNKKTSSICIDASAVDDVDFSAAETLRSLFEILKAKGTRLVVAQILDDVKTKSRHQFRRLFGEDAFYDTLEDYKQKELGSGLHS